MMYTLRVNMIGIILSTELDIKSGLRVGIFKKAQARINITSLGVQSSVLESMRMVLTPRMNAPDT